MIRNFAVRRWFALFFVVALILGPQAAATAADRDALLAATASITKDELKNHIDVLADDTFEGREAGSRGGRAAGNYILKAFESYGLVPAGEGGTYVQSFNGSSRNILGLVEGSDPQLKQQTILVGAHYDHVGYGRRTNSFGPWGYIHNGADDNASGVSGLLEIVDAVKKLPEAPKHSILFACWDGEEQGLLGSRHWVGHPTIPLARIALAVNMDMIGRMKNGKLEVLGSRSGAGFRRFVSEANLDSAATIDFDWTLKADSDHWPFYERHIPILMFHTGLHEDYHRPSDDAHRINQQGLEGVARIVFRMLARVADADQIPTFREAVLRESAALAGSLEQPVPAQPPRFGIPFKVEEGDPPKIILTGLTPGAPAYKSGLKVGDQILEIQGEPIRDVDRFRLQLLAAHGQTTFLVKREGNETPLLIKVTPAGEPIRIGLSWRADPGEPGTVILTQVIYGSPAHIAGLKLRDRIYSVGGQAFKTTDEFVTLLGTAPSPIEMVVEREGKLQTLTLTVLDEPPAAE
jgi:hypothetical protein